VGCEREDVDQERRGSRWGLALGRRDCRGAGGDSLASRHGHHLRFRWDTFNLTNTPSYDVQFLDVFPDRASTFGRYYNTIATCDGGAGRCMQFALRYEF
jgi:hypothetical protein